MLVMGTVYSMALVVVGAGVGLGVVCGCEGEGVSECLCERMNAYKDTID